MTDKEFNQEALETAIEYWNSDILKDCLTPTGEKRLAEAISVYLIALPKAEAAQGDDLKIFEELMPIISDTILECATMTVDFAVGGNKPTKGDINFLINKTITRLKPYLRQSGSEEE